MFTQHWKSILTLISRVEMITGKQMATSSLFRVQSKSDRFLLLDCNTTKLFVFWFNKRILVNVNTRFYKHHRYKLRFNHRFFEFHENIGAQNAWKLTFNNNQLSRRISSRFMIVFQLFLIISDIFWPLKPVKSTFWAKWKWFLAKMSGASCFKLERRNAVVQ